MNRKWTCHLRGSILALVVVMVALAAGRAQAAHDVLYWDANGATTGTGGAGTWDTVTSLWRLNSSSGTLQAWSNAGSGNGVFDANLSGTAGIVTNAEAITLGNLVFGTDGYIITNTSPANNLLFSGADVLISNSVAAATKIYTPIKTDSGSVLTLIARDGTFKGIYLYASNSIGGSVVVSGPGAVSSGMVELDNANALFGATSVIVTNGGTLRVPGIAIGGLNVTISGRTNQTSNGAALQNQNTGSWSGNVILADDSSIGSRSGPFTISGKISGSHALYINNNIDVYGGNMVVLSGINTYTGPTYVNGVNNIGGAGVSISTNVNLGDQATGATLTLSDAVLATTATLALDNNGANKRDVVLSGSNTFNVASGTTLTIGGIVSGSGSFSKTSAGTLVLSGANTFQGQARIQQGTLSVASLNSVVGGSASSSLGAPTTVANGMISLGATTTATLLYTGSGETSDRIVNLACSSVGSTLDQSGAGTLKFTSALTNSWLASKTLTLQGSNVGTGELAGSIPDGAPGTTMLDANFANNVNTITLGSVSGVSVGAAISGTSIAAGTTITNINTATRVVSLSANTTNSATAGALYTVTGVINPTAIAKVGTGTWILSGANTYNGSTTITGGTLQIGNGGTSGTLGNGVVSNNAALVFKRSDNVTVSNNIVGTGSLTVAGTGTTTLLGTNTYSGATIISNGMLQVGNGGTIGSLGSGAVTNNGTLLINRSDSVTLMNNMAGNGVTTVNGGTLKVIPTGTLPSDVAGNLVLNLDASTLSQADGSTVTGLADQSPIANNAVPHDDANKPTFNAPGSAAALNGRGTIHINGGTQGLQTQSNVTISNNNSRSIFVVMRRNGANNMRVEWGVDSGNQAFGVDSGNSYIYLPYTFGSGDKTYTARAADTYEIYEVTHDSGNSNSYGYVNGTFMGILSANISTVATNAHIGWRSTGSSYGDFAQMLVYNTVLTDAQRQRVESYLNYRWFNIGSMGNALPTNSALQLTSGGNLDLNGSSQTLANLTGSGSVSNGTLTVTGVLMPGGTNIVGTLAVISNLVVGANSTYYWDYGSGNDAINVSGSLTLPNVATVNVNRVASGRMPNPAVLFNFGTGLGSAVTDTNLNWVITGARSDTRAVVRGKQVQLLSTTGMILEIY